jgi:carbamoyltransferase
MNSNGSGIILGINLSHDRSACLLIDGHICYAIAEERLSRRKHDIPLNIKGERYAMLPTRAIEYCLTAGGCKFSDIDLCVASTTYVLDAHSGKRRHLTESDVAWQFPQIPVNRIRVISHHLGHAVSAAWCSGFKHAAVLVVDGGGSIIDYSPNGSPKSFERTTIYSYHTGGLPEVLLRSTGGPPSYGNSLGDFYQLITEYLGFRAGEEGKTMGLSAYGSALATAGSYAPLKPLPQFANAITVHQNGEHCVSPSFQWTAQNHFPEQLIEWFGLPRKVAQPESEIDQQIAASTQWVLEEAMLAIATCAKQRTCAKNLCLAGGVALNCVANGRLLRESGFEELFIQPASSDDGTAIGNALLGWFLHVGQVPAEKLHMPYLGRDYSFEVLSAALSKYEALIDCHPVDNIAKDIASSIATGHIVAIFRGKSEFGPRALGHRSICCDPRIPSMKDDLNLRVKHRESFRPFAPLVTWHKAKQFFDLAVPSPHMLIAARVLMPDKLPAVTHVDGTARIQTVSEHDEPFLNDLLCAFEAITGIPIILNTSFNLAGQPIVESPIDALDAFVTSEIDILYLQDYRITHKTKPLSVASRNECKD